MSSCGALRDEVDMVSIFFKVPFLNLVFVLTVFREFEITIRTLD